MKNTTTLKSSLLLLCLTLTSIWSSAQIAAWNFTGENTLATSAAEVYNANMDESNLLTRGAGAAASAGANSFRTVGFQNNGISTANTDYFQFTLSSSAGYILSLSSINARFAGEATFMAGPGVTSQFAYSLDGTNFTLIGSPVTSTFLIMPQVNLAAVSELQDVPASVTVTIRYYASGQTTTGGWGFNSSVAGVDGLAIGGSVSTTSSNTNLSNLTLSSGTLAPAFAAATTNYTTSVANGVTSITVTPTSSNSSATITVNGVPVISGSASAAISLGVGNNTITTVVTAQNGVSTKNYALTVTRFSGVALPITLHSFQVQKVDNNTAKIIWTTEQEINSSRFVIERSTDGRTWNSIGALPAAGNSSTRKSYSALDNTPLQGVNFYRLKMIDIDGSYEYSDIGQAFFNSYYTAQVSPNPAKDVINLYISKSGNQNANIELLNVEGKVVYKTSSSQSHIPLKTQGLTKGLYFVKIIEADKLTTIRVVLQ